MQPTLRFKPRTIFVLFRDGAHFRMISSRNSSILINVIIANLQIAAAQFLHVYKARNWINCGQAGPPVAVGRPVLAIAPPECSTADVRVTFLAKPGRNRRRMARPV